MDPDLIFAVSPPKIKYFHFLLQQGINIQTVVGENLYDFLLHQLGFHPDEVAEKIQTVFLNGRVVDDLSQAVVRDSDYLALSGALPGLVGATMRRGGFYASLRNSINYREEKGDSGLKEGTIRLKLFNILLGDLGPRVLANGFQIAQPQLLDFLRRNQAELMDGCRIVWPDGREMPCRDFPEGSAGGSDVPLVVKVIPE